MSIDRNTNKHLHAFVFVDHTEAKIADVLEGLARFKRETFPRVWWAGSVVGDYRAFAHVEVEDPNDLAGLQTFIEEDLWEVGVRCKWATELAVVNRRGAKYATPEILALIGIKTKHGRTRAVAEQLAKIDAARGKKWFKGASIVTGHLDIVLQLNADSFLETQDRLFLNEKDAALLGDIKGIAWTSTAVADGRRGPFAKVGKN